MQTSRPLVIAVRTSDGRHRGLSASGCGTPVCEQTGAADYLVLFTDGTTVERVSDIVRQADSMILRSLRRVSVLSTKSAFPTLKDASKDSAMFHRFPEVVTVVRAVNLQVH